MAVAASFELLLWLYWILATGAVVVALLPTSIVGGFRDAVTLSACRGKLWEGRPSNALGPLTDVSIPQAWFLHFYLVGAAVNLLVLTLLQGASIGDAPIREFTVVVLVLLELHLVRRAIETAVVMKYPKDAKMHLIAYLFGMSYYIVLPLSVLPASVLSPLLHPSTWDNLCPSRLAHMNATWQEATTQQLLGAVTFVCGMALQYQSHKILGGLQRSLRHAKKMDDAADTQQYSIPHGGMFCAVSCPHYLGEIVIYSGLAAMAAQGQKLVLLVLAWVVLNLVLAANRTHRWYHTHFPDYPKHRKALVPYVF